MNFLDGHDNGKSLYVLQFELLERFPATFAGFGKEELNPGEGNTHGTVGELLLVLEHEEVVAELGFGDLLWGRFAIIRQLPYGTEIASVSPFGQAAKVEVFGHGFVVLSAEEWGDLLWIGVRNWIGHE